MADDTDVEQDKDVKKRRFPDSPTPGEMLLKARQERKLDTKEIAATMNVDPWMLDALEHDEYTALGAPVFAKGHLRKYAKALGLDEGDVMVSYYQIDGTREAPPPLVAESILRVESRNGSRLSWLAPAAGVLALALIAVVLFLYFQPGDGAESARAASVTVPQASGGEADERILSLPLTRNEAPAKEAPAAVAKVAPTPVVPRTEVKPAPAPTPAPDVASVAEKRKATPTIDTPASVASAPEQQPQPAQEKEPQPEPRAVVSLEPEALRSALSTTLSSPDDVRVTLSFEGESWVEVYDANRAKLLYDMGQSGTRRSVSGPGPLQVFLGKAVDVEVMVNGRPYSVPQVSRLGTARFYVDAKSL